MKWMQWALNGKGRADLASTFHLTGVDHKQITLHTLRFEI